MFSVTADTNIYISGLVFGGLPRRFLDLARAGAFRLNISDALKQEMLRVLREKFEYSTEALRSVDESIDRIAQHVSPKQEVYVITTDPSDNRVLECAIAAKSDFIVSGDAKHVLPLRSYGGIRILNVAEFLEILQLQWADE